MTHNKNKEFRSEARVFKWCVDISEVELGCGKFVSAMKVILLVILLKEIFLLSLNIRL